MDSITLEMPPWPSYSQAEVEATTEVLRSGKVNYWTGTIARKFEQDFAARMGVSHGIAVANGSVALGIALRALDLPQGAEVVVTPRTFVASVSEILLAGARPVFADVDRDSQNITAASIERVISSRTAAIMTVHLAGWPCDMPKVTELARDNRIAIIEDCAQSHGAGIAGRTTGAWGDVAAFSFCQDKIMSTGGEGGMIVTDDELLARRCWSFKDHGKSPELLGEKRGSSTAFRWLHESLGTNARMTEVQAAIGAVQLAKLDDWIRQRHANAACLTARLAEVPGIRTTVPPSEVLHAYYKYYCFVEPHFLHTGWDRERILDRLSAAGIPCGSGICPEVYREKAIRQFLDDAPETLPVARELGETSLMFPVHPTLDSSHMHRIADALESIMKSATRAPRRYVSS